MGKDSPPKKSDNLPKKKGRPFGSTNQRIFGILESELPNIKRWASADCPPKWIADAIEIDEETLVSKCGKTMKQQRALGKCLLQERIVAMAASGAQGTNTAMAMTAKELLKWQDQKNYNVKADVTNIQEIKIGDKIIKF